jgi:hypothetical protein
MSAEERAPETLAELMKAYLRDHDSDEPHERWVVAARSVLAVLTTERDALQAQLTVISTERDNWRGDFQEACRQLGLSLIALAACREALERFGRHPDTCAGFKAAWRYESVPCDCGLSAALAVHVSQCT